MNTNTNSMEWYTRREAKSIPETGEFTWEVTGRVMLFSILRKSTDLHSSLPTGPLVCSTCKSIHAINSDPSLLAFRSIYAQHFRSALLRYPVPMAVCCYHISNTFHYVYLQHAYLARVYSQWRLWIPIRREKSRQLQFWNYVTEVARQKKGSWCLQMDCWKITCSSPGSTMGRTASGYVGVLARARLIFPSFLFLSTSSFRALENTENLQCWNASVTRETSD